MTSNSAVNLRCSSRDDLMLLQFEGKHPAVLSQAKFPFTSISKHYRNCFNAAAWCVGCFFLIYYSEKKNSRPNVGMYTSIMWMESQQGQNCPILLCFFPRYHSKGLHSNNKLQLCSSKMILLPSLKMENIKLSAPAGSLGVFCWGAITLIWVKMAIFRWSSPLDNHLL